jgi:hypothetical protein
LDSASRRKNRPRSDHPDSQFPKPSVSTADITTLSCFGQQCILGEGATELIHIGQTVLAFEGSINFLLTTVFNYPTLAECYKVAALNGMNRLHYASQPAEGVDYATD